MKGLLQTVGLGENMDRNPLKDPLIPGVITDAAVQRVVQLKKQVERCSKDASLFIITYTSSHNHPGPNLPNNVAQEPIVDQHVSLKDNYDDNDDDDPQSCKSPLNSTTTSSSISQGILEENLLTDNFLGTISYGDFLPLSYPQLMKFPKSELSEENDFYDELGELELPPSCMPFAGIFEEEILVDPSS